MIEKRISFNQVAVSEERVVYALCVSFSTTY